MTLPIQYALTAPERVESPAKKLDLLQCTSLTFGEPDLQTFTCLADCIEAAKRGGLYPCLLNGANEEAVALFLQDKIEYLQLFASGAGNIGAFCCVGLPDGGGGTGSGCQSPRVCTQPRRTKTVWMCKVKFPGEY